MLSLLYVTIALPVKQWFVQGLTAPQVRCPAPAWVVAEESGQGSPLAVCSSSETFSPQKAPRGPARSSSVWLVLCANNTKYNFKRRLPLKTRVLFYMIGILTYFSRYLIWQQIFTQQERVETSAKNINIQIVKMTKYAFQERDHFYLADVVIRTSAFTLKIRRVNH